MLKLCFDDKEMVPHLVQIVKEKKYTKRRFAVTILDEISKFVTVCKPNRGVKRSG